MTQQPSGPGPDRYRGSMSLLATGVTVVTMMTADGPAGMTASAVCSLSLEPPLLLVCVRTSLPTHNALQASGQFGVSGLGEDQIDIARRFATPGADRFTGLDLRPELPVPVLRPAIAYFSCAVAERFPGGDHSIFTGRVLACGTSRAGGRCCISVGGSPLSRARSRDCCAHGRKADRWCKANAAVSRPARQRSGHRPR